MHFVFAACKINSEAKLFFIETHKNEPLSNAWRIYNAADSKRHVVFTKKADDKQKWKEAFEKEKQKANEEAHSGNHLND